MKEQNRFVRILFAALLLVPLTAAHASDFHVSTRGSDTNPGTRAAPFRTIQHAADLAQPGDVITVHEGTYRERISPPRGGESDTKRIVYQAAKGGKVEIKGSEIVKNWEKVRNDVWKVILPNSFSGKFNPFSDIIQGDWFDDKGRVHHTGAVYLNGEWLTEAVSLEDIMKPANLSPLWFGQVDTSTTTIWAQFKGVNPNAQTVEINVRRTVFYPEKTGINYITVRGFTLRDAATPWAPPTAEQTGLIGTHWSKGWIIENNVISHSVCSGVSLGKYGDEWDNKSANSAEGYVATIKRALENGWNKETIGHHMVRNNTISHCEQAGIIGSLIGVSYSYPAGTRTCLLRSITGPSWWTTTSSFRRIRSTTVRRAVRMCTTCLPGRYALCRGMTGKRLFINLIPRRLRGCMITRAETTDTTTTCLSGTAIWADMTLQSSR